jgi:N-acetylneuraminic acid mutarotase
MIERMSWPRAGIVPSAVFGVALALLGVDAPVQAQSTPPGSTPPGIWTTKAPMPGGVRGEVSAVVYDNKLYAVGGNVASNAVPRNEGYDPASNSWRMLAPMPVARDHLGIAVLNGKIYTFGGFVKTVHAGAGTDVFEYDIASDTWRARAPLKTPLGGTGAAVIDGKIHVLGGRGLDGVTAATHAVYDPATDTWSDAAPLPKARDHLGVVAAEGKIHAIAGRFTSPIDRTDMHDVYDPKTNTWSAAAPLKTPRSAVAAALYKGMIVVDGGEWPPEKRTFTENEGYDLKTNSWVTLAPMPEQGRHGFGAGVIGPNLYFVGGAKLPGGGELSDTLLMFTLP